MQILKKIIFISILSISNLYSLDTAKEQEKIKDEITSLGIFPDEIITNQLNQQVIFPRNYIKTAITDYLDDSGSFNDVKSIRNEINEAMQYNQIWPKDISNIIADYANPLYERFEKLKRFYELNKYNFPDLKKLLRDLKAFAKETLEFQCHESELSNSIYKLATSLMMRLEHGYANNQNPDYDKTESTFVLYEEDDYLTEPQFLKKIESFFSDYRRFNDYRIFQEYYKLCRYLTYLKIKNSNLLNNGINLLKKFETWVLICQENRIAIQSENLDKELIERLDKSLEERFNSASDERIQYMLKQYKDFWDKI